MLQKLLLSLSVLISTGAFAADTKPAEKARYYVPEVPSDVSNVDFYLLTVGVGEEVANRFGHTGIRIVDRNNNSDVVYNWGRYFFDQAGFLWKFYRGSLVYGMGIRTFQAEVMRHMTDERRLVMEKINLTTSQKRRLFEKIAWNALPENRDFAYQYWYKNCSTIPRDYLDEVLEGQVRAKFFAERIEPRYRHYVRHNLAAVPFVAPGLDIMMNGNIDRPITSWEQMFLPRYLREQLLRMPTIDDEGNPVPGTHLLSETQVLLDRPEPFDGPFNDYLALMAPTGFGLIGALVVLARRRRPTPGFYRFLGGATFYWGILAGLLGVTLALNWAFSGHPDGWHNANLLIFWPIDLALVPFGFKMLRRGSGIKDRWPVLNAGKFFCLAHFAALLALVLVTAIGVIQQNVWLAVGWFGVPSVALFALVLAYGFIPYEAKVEAADSPKAVKARPQVKAATRRKLKTVR